MTSPIRGAGLRRQGNSLVLSSVKTLYADKRLYADKVPTTETPYSRPSSSCTSSDILDLSQGGSNTRLTFALSIPSTALTAFRTQLNISPATGQPGAVSVMSI